MKKIFLFSSRLCKDCPPMKEYLTENNIDYIDMDITENLLFLKMFLKYRDNNPEFDAIKANGFIGIPCVVLNEGEKFFFDKDTLNVNELK
ncbi:MAG: glutaredoxin [Clostridiaceae bacterium]